MRMTRRSELLARGLPLPALRVVEAAGRLAGELGIGCALVGGSVRDLLLGRAVDEMDLVIEGDEPRFAGALAQALSGAVASRSRFGTAKLEVPGGPRVDLAAARTESYPRPGALPETRPASIEEDLVRRDLTLNAMAIRLEPACRGVLLDRCGGVRDLRGGLLRVLHGRSFEDDPTRGFRAVRLAVRLRFRLEEGTRTQLAAALAAGALGTVSGPRVCRELDLAATELPLERVASAFSGMPLLSGIHPALEPMTQTLALLRRLDAIAGPARGDDGGFSNAGQESREPLLTAQAPDRFALLLGALLQDASAADAKEALGRLGMAGRPKERVLRLATDAASLGERLASAGSASAITATAEGASCELLLLACACRSEALPAAREWAGRLRRVQPLLAGQDLAALGVPQGPARSLALKRLRAARLDGRLASREEEIAFVRRMDHGESS